MNRNLTAIAAVVDRSGSMEPLVDDAIGGFNAFLAAQQAAPGEVRLTLALFDHEILVPCLDQPIAAVPPLDRSTYVPRGSTALLDAIGTTIDELGLRLAHTPEAERPGTVIVAILTDGHENASTRYRSNQIADRIAHQRAFYDWEFVFLAANEDAIITAQSLAIPAVDARSFRADHAGVEEVYLDLHQRVEEKKRRRRE